MFHRRIWHWAKASHILFEVVVTAGQPDVFDRRGKFEIQVDGNLRRSPVWDEREL